jgi:predicted Zn-dependent protease
MAGILKIQIISFLQDEECGILHFSDFEVILSKNNTNPVMNRNQVLVLSMLVLLQFQCATVPLTGRKQFTLIPSSQVLSLSNDSYNQVLKENKISSNAQYINTVNQVGHHITAAVEKYFADQKQSSLLNGYEWKYNVLVSKEMNAWCMPGGKIVFYEGIMPVCIDADGVAVVMSHEIAHAIANHGNERMSQELAVQFGGMALDVALAQKPEATRQIALSAFGVGSSVGVLLPYSRKHESEADELGLYFMAMAGYNPAKAIDFWQRMMEQSKGAPPEFLSTHPSDQTRINQLKAKMGKAMEFYNKSQKK